MTDYRHRISDPAVSVAQQEEEETTEDASEKENRSYENNSNSNSNHSHSNNVVTSKYEPLQPQSEDGWTRITKKKKKKKGPLNNKTL